VISIEPKMKLATTSCQSFQLTFGSFMANSMCKWTNDLVQMPCGWKTKCKSKSIEKTANDVGLNGERNKTVSLSLTVFLFSPWVGYHFWETHQSPSQQFTQLMVHSAPGACK
jgi:hypothetical protein